MGNKIHIPNGLFVAIEGIDGTGKTTLLLSLESTLGKDFNLYTTREPSDTEAGRDLRKSFVEGRLTPEEESALFVEDRKLHVENEITPFLENGFIVVTDRYYFSNFAYQGSAGVPINKLKEMNSKFPIPDIVLYIDLDVDTSLNRVNTNRGVSDFMEKRENIVKVKSIYNRLKKDYSSIFVTIDGSKDPTLVSNSSTKAILSKAVNKIIDGEHLSFVKKIIKNL